MLDVAPPDSMKNEDLRLFESSVDRFLQRAAPQRFGAKPGKRDFSA
jgi:hypothetical protein